MQGLKKRITILFIKMGNSTKSQCERDTGQVLGDGEAGERRQIFTEHLLRKALC